MTRSGFSWRLRLLRSAVLHERDRLLERSLLLGPDEYADYRLVSKVKDKEVAANVEQGD